MCNTSSDSLQNVYVISISSPLTSELKGTRERMLIGSCASSLPFGSSSLLHRFIISLSKTLVDSYLRMESGTPLSTMYTSKG